MRQTRPAWLLALWLGLGPLASQPAGPALGQSAPVPSPNPAPGGAAASPQAGQGAALPAAAPAMPATTLPPSLAQRAPQRVTVRTGQHPGFSRVVFDWPELPGYTLVQQGDVVELVFGPAGTLAFEAASVRPPRNIVSVEPLSGGLRLRLAPGSRARHFVLGRRVVVDLLDPPAPPTPPGQRQAGRATPSLATPGPAAGPGTSGLPPAAAVAPANPPAAAAPPAATALAPPGPAAPLLVAPAAPPAPATPRLAAPAPAPGPAAPPAAAPAAPPAPSHAAAPHPPAGGPQLAPQASMRALEAIADRLATPPPMPGASATPPAAAPAPAAPGPQAALTPPTAPAPDTLPAAPPVAPPPGQAAPLPLEPTPPLAVPNPVTPRPAAPPAAPPPQAAPALPAPAAPPPVAARPASQRLAPDAPVPLPFGRSAAAAALQRGGALLLAFDDARAPDLAALRRLSPALARLQALEVPGSTVLRLPLTPGAPVPALRRDADGIWMLHPAGAGGGDAIGLDQEEGEAPRLLLRARAPGRVIAVPDPQAPGGLLLLGLLPAPSRGLPIGAGFAPFDLLPTDQGVAVAARDPAVQLRAVPEGFAIPLASSGPLAIGPVQQRVAVAADEVPRLLNLPQELPAALLERRRKLFAELIAAPPLARGPLRLQLAETLLGLGLGAEAQALTQLALEEDPRMAGEPRALLLLAASALLAGRAEEALAPLEDLRLPPEGEAALWRALARMQLSGEAPADAALAAALSRNAPLLLRYPPTLRDRLLPPVARSLAEAGSLRDAAALLQAAGPVESAPYAFARARLAEARGDLDTALPAYEKLAEGRDRDIRDRARGRIAEAGLASGRLEPGAAAAMLEAAIPAWRGDARELARRLRAAELYEQARQHESALALLEETEQLFPDAADQVRARTGRALLGVLNDPATPVMEAAQTFVRRQDALPPGAALDAAALRIAEGLAALDLYDPAAELLGRAAERSERPAPLRLRLAELQVADGEGEAALATLRALPVAALPPELRPRHALAQARALALAGNLTEATQALRGVGPAGAAKLADLLAAQQDWPGAADALAAHAAATLPAAPAPLDAGQRQMLLRLAAFRALAGDETRMAELRNAYGARMRGGPLAEAFATLTTPPAGPGAPELQRLRQELAMGRALSDALR